MDMEFREALQDFIGAELLDDDVPVAADENLLADGMVSSLGMLRLVSFIEDTWNISVPPEHFTIENFRTVETLDAYLSGRMAESGSSLADG
jgi:acyl carrier protein